jgi:3-deoxy-7-phosphoheptulonate synthase
VAVAPNYGSASIERACGDLASAGLAQRVMVDFSHANSSKQYQKQLDVGATSPASSPRASAASWA